MHGAYIFEFFLHIRFCFVQSYLCVRLCLIAGKEICLFFSRLFINVCPISHFFASAQPGDQRGQGEGAGGLQRRHERRQG